jgi:hypothetical protein
MALNLNGVEVDGLYLNGTECETGYLNGTEVYKAGNPIVVTVSNYATLFVYNADNLSLINSFTIANTDPSYSQIALSPNSDFVVIASNYAVNVYDIATGSTLYTQANTSQLGRCAVSRDGSLIAFSADATGSTVYIVNTSTWTFSSYITGVSSMRVFFGADNTYIYANRYYDEYTVKIRISDSTVVNSFYSVNGYSDFLVSPDETVFLGVSRNTKSELHNGTSKYQLYGNASAAFRDDGNIFSSSMTTTLTSGGLRVQSKTDNSEIASSSSTAVIANSALYISSGFNGDRLFALTRNAIVELNPYTLAYIRSVAITNNSCALIAYQSGE